MFKKRERPAPAANAARRRSADDSDGEGGAVVPDGASKKQRLTSGAAGSNEGGHIGATTRKGDSDAASKLEKKLADATFSGFKATGERAPGPADDVTRQLQIDTEHDRDNRAVQERNLKIHEGLKDGTLEEGVYRGLSAYKKYSEPGEGAIHAAKYNGLLGPTRGTMTNVRSTLRVMYWGVSGDGGICKDYKETGYCGYGDSCIYMHDRSDYKQGYHLDREWDAKQKKIEEQRKARWERRLLKVAAAKAEGRDAEDISSSEEEDKDSDDEEELPKSCPACDRKWEDCTSTPIQTVCGHHFCEDCAMENYAKTPKCMTCDAPTGGIFNSCESLEAKLKERRAAKAAKKSGGSAGASSGGSKVSWQVHMDT